MPEYSVIIPVHNRIDEWTTCFKSLSCQTDKDFETVIVEDGSTDPCDATVEKYKNQVDVKYFYQGERRSLDSTQLRNRARFGTIFHLLRLRLRNTSLLLREVTRKALAEKHYDCFGGPDTAHESFSDTQKAINYSHDIVPDHRRHTRRQSAA